MNQVWLNGRLASDPEGGESGQGVSYATFAVAIEKGSGENKQAMFLDVVTFRQQADFVKQYLHRGDAVNVTGSINVRDWEDQSGVKRRKFEIVATQVSFPVSGKGRGAGASGGYSGRGQAPRNGRAAPVGAGAGRGDTYGEMY